MRPAIIVVENFYEDPDVVHDYALSQRYYFPYQRDADVASGKLTPSWMTTWFREASECPFKSSAALRAKLESAVGEQIDMHHWNASFPVDEEGKAHKNCRWVTPRSCFWNCCFHVKTCGIQEHGEGVHNHVTDGWNSVGENGWAGLIYFNLDAPLSGGLKLWRNRDSLRNMDWMTPRENWEMIDEFGNVYNRLILCRGNLPHSGAAGWGDNPQNGRLYQTFFFKTLKPRITAGLSVDLIGNGKPR
jgi:hypothetical protein